MVEELLDWESNALNLPFHKHMIAGSCAGVTEHTISYPFDTIKTYAQAESTRLASFSETKAMIRQNGLFRLWGGVTSVIMGCVPAHAAYFSIYEMSKHTFSIEANSEFYLFSTMTTGALATIAHDTIMTPMDGNS